MKQKTAYPFALANRFWEGDGLIVPVEEAEDADEESSSGASDRKCPSWSAFSSSSFMRLGGSGGNFASIFLAKDF